MDIPTDAATATNAVLTDAIEALSEGMAIYDADSRLLMCNERYRAMLHPIRELIVPGAEFGDLLRACAARRVYAAEIDDVDAWVAEVTAEPWKRATKAVVTHSDGRSYRVSYDMTASGGFVVTRSDITERRLAESRLREREELLSTILATNPTPVVMSRLRDGLILYRSPAAFDVYGETRFVSEYYVDPADRDAYADDLRRRGRVHDAEYKVRGADGRVMHVSLTGALTEYNGETCVVSSVTDLTEQIEREALIRRVVEACPAPILMNRASTGEILYRSPMIVALFGEIDDARSFYVDPLDRRGFLSALRSNGEVVEYRSRFRDADGRIFWGAVSARLIRWDGEDVIVSHTRDLTNQLDIEAELTRQRAQLFQNEKMSALGGLLAGVAHELNNPLSVVVGHAMMLEDEARDPDVRRKTRKISEAAERCARIVKTFLAMARQEPARTAPSDLTQIVETAIDVARYGDPRWTAAIETDLADDLPPLPVDADQITQVLINLVVNAEQAIGDAGTGDRITIRARHVPAEDRVRIEVEDNGPGVRPDIRGRVFEPFFTTKGVGKGTGIGLAMCHRIVTAHNGQISLEPADPRGTRIVVSLPLTQPDTARPDVPAEPAGTGALLKVLVIDDEEDVADLNAEVLARGGFQVDVAYDAAQAVDMLRDTSFDVVISDLNMPGLDGRGFYETIRAEFPELAGRTGFITGDTMGQASQGFLKEAGRPYLEKPVSPGELRDFVSRLSAGGEGDDG